MKILTTIKRCEVEFYLRNYNSFKSGSYLGFINGNHYVVMSYATVIAKVDITTNDLIYFDDNKYSTTTSFIQNLVAKVFKDKE